MRRPLGIGEGVKSPSHLAQHAPVSESAEIFARDPILVQIPRPEHTRLFYEFENTGFL